MRLLPVLGLAAADEGHRVAAAGIGDRDAGVGRDADGGGDARDHLERHGVLVQEQRLLAAAVEDERVAPLQACDHLAFARLLGDEIADRLLLERFGRRRTDVDPLGPGARLPQQALVHEVVVDHDVGLPQASDAAHGDEPRIPGTGSDQVHNRCLHSGVRDSPSRRGGARCPSHETTTARKSPGAEAGPGQPWPEPATSVRPEVPRLVRAVAPVAIHADRQAPPGAVSLRVLRHVPDDVLVGQFVGDLPVDAGQVLDAGREERAAAGLPAPAAAGRIVRDRVGLGGDLERATAARWCRCAVSDRLARSSSSS